MFEVRAMLSGANDREWPIRQGNAAEIGLRCLNFRKNRSHPPPYPAWLASLARPPHLRGGRAPVPSAASDWRAAHLQAAPSGAGPLVTCLRMLWACRSSAGFSAIGCQNQVGVGNEQQMGASAQETPFCCPVGLRPSPPCGKDRPSSERALNNRRLRNAAVAQW